MTLDQNPWPDAEPVAPVPTNAPAPGPVGPTAPAPGPVGPTAPEPGSLSLGAPVPTPAPTDRDPGGRGPGVRAVLAAAVLSAVLASGGTAAILLASAPAAAPPAVATPIPTQTPAGASLTRLDAGSAVAAVAATIEPSVVTIAATGGGRFASAGGSGIVVSADGLILTTTVAVPVDGSYSVLFSDERQSAARVVASDPSHGLVLLRADATGLVPARLTTADTLAVGQVVIAVGSPLGEFTDTVTAGIVSGLDRSIDLRDPSTRQRVTLDGLIQTDAAVNAGSSGGPLLDAAGTVVGVIATSASNGQGIGFAIPAGIARDLVAQATP